MRAALKAERERKEVYAFLATCPGVDDGKLALFDRWGVESWDDLTYLHPKEDFGEHADQFPRAALAPILEKLRERGFKK